MPSSSNEICPEIRITVGISGRFYITKYMKSTRKYIAAIPVIGWGFRKYEEITSENIDGLLPKM